MSQTTSRAASNRLHEVASEYSHDTPRPLGGYLLLMGTFMGLFVAFLSFLWLTGRNVPDRIGTRDVVLLGVATHDLGRIIAKAGVTSPLRAPFTQYEGTSGPPAELAESVRARGLRHAVGELVTCPFCISLWVAAFFSYGYVLAPRLTRLVATIFAIDAISDNLNLVYDATANVATKIPDLLSRAADE
jgi:hypothetical protein